MIDNLIQYEQPLNERIRTFLRLEELFAETNHTLSLSSIWDAKATFASMIEISSIFERGDLKSEVIKELERHISNLHRLQKSPDVDSSKLQSVLDQLHGHVERLTNIIGKIGHNLKENELISTVRQRITIPGGTCNFDLPFYHYWLQQPYEARKADLITWLSEFNPIADAVTLILGLIRDSACPTEVNAVNGFFQKPLEPSTPCQLVRIKLLRDYDVFPEVSGGKHRISVRFLSYSGEGRPTQTTESIPFELSCCVI